MDITTNNKVCCLVRQNILPLCVLTDTASQIATVSICPLCCTWLGISNSKSAQHTKFGWQEISGTEDIHKDLIKLEPSLCL